MKPNETEDSRAQWRAEMAAAWLLAVVAEQEPDAVNKKLFAGLAEASRRQAAILAGDQPAIAEFRPSPRLRLIALMVRLFTPRRCRLLLAAAKVRGMAVYSGAPAGGGHVMPTSVADFGGRHRGAGGGVLRAAVFGANDGLVSNTCLILGVAGAASDDKVVLLTGVAGLLAGAFSMAAGEYVSVRSQRELFEYQIGLERAELERYPAEEAEELALIYNARGVPIEEARALAGRLLQNPKQALDTLAREELGLNPDDLGSPWGAAGYSFVSFALGASLPLVPYLLSTGAHSLFYSAGLSALALFGVGAALSLFSGRGALIGGFRMLLIGSAAGAATYGIGSLLGVGIG